MSRDLLHTYAELAGPILVQNFGRRSCIASTRALVEVMKYSGVDVKPLAVAISVVNAKWQLHREHGDAKQEDLAAWARVGGRSYCLNGAEQPGAGDFRWHVVGIVAGCLVDSSAGQFSDPEADCYVPDILVVDCPSEFARGYTVATHPKDKVVPEPPGAEIFDAVVQYKAAPASVRFNHLPAWKADAHQRNTVAAIIAAMKL